MNNFIKTSVQFVPTLVIAPARFRSSAPNMTKQMPMWDNWSSDGLEEEDKEKAKQAHIYEWFLEQK